MKKKKLTNGEYESLLKTMRYWEKAPRDVAAELVYYINYLQDKIATLDKHIEKLAQSEMTGVIRDQAFVPKPEKIPTHDFAKPDYSRCLNLKDRLKKMFSDGLKDSREWELTLRFNNLTEEKALIIVGEE